jgi:alanyl-tRNA synthetase
MGGAYPELGQRQAQIEAVLLDEEERFSRTLDAGMDILQGVIEKSGGEIDGSTAFLLYDTYGFPLDLTQDIAREHGLGVDHEGFDRKWAGSRKDAHQFNLPRNFPRNFPACR